LCDFQQVTAIFVEWIPRSVRLSDDPENDENVEGGRRGYRPGSTSVGPPFNSHRGLVSNRQQNKHREKLLRRLLANWMLAGRFKSNFLMLISIDEIVLPRSTPAPP